MAKTVGKRSAFGDLSNTTVLKPKDDSGNANKALARPAQRPASLSASSVVPPVEAAPKPLAVQGNTRKPLARRNTVFRDPSLPSVPESAVFKGGAHTRQAVDDAKTTAVTARLVNADDAQAPVKDEAEHEKPVDVGSNASKTTNVKSEREIEEHVEKLNDMQLASGSVVAGNLADMPADTVYDLPADMSDAADNVEESWDEEYDENYDDDYATATKSQPCRADNTTGPATVVLFPKYDREAKQELTLARKVVEVKGTTREEYEDERFDTSMVAEYGTEIFQYMGELEVCKHQISNWSSPTNIIQRRLMPNPHYMDNQAEIQWSMRSVLMDWLVQVHLRFGLLPETLYLCVNYIDRFLSCKVVSLGKLQLVGATAIFIAAKYEEINCPSVKEIVYMVDNGYKAEEILKAERYMLSMLQFELGWPGPMSFLRRISKADDYDVETRTLAKYFLEVTIMDERFVGSPPSYLAASAHCISRLMLRKGPWVCLFYKCYLPLTNQQ